MSTPVFTWPYSSDGFRFERNVEIVKLDLGGGIYRTGIKASAWTHQDGTGGADTGHLGNATFTVTMRPVTYGGGTFTGVLDFLQARLDAGIEAFYLYDPNVQPDSANWDGVTTAGRHLVIHAEGRIRWKMLHRQSCQFDPFTFLEVPA